MRRVLQQLQPKESVFCSTWEQSAREASPQAWCPGSAPAEFACVPPFPHAAVHRMFILLRCSWAAPSLCLRWLLQDRLHPRRAQWGLQSPPGLGPAAPPGLAGDSSALNTNKEYFSKESAATARESCGDLQTPSKPCTVGPDGRSGTTGSCHIPNTHRKIFLPITSPIL